MATQKPTYKLQWHGPFAWYGPHSLFEEPLAQSAGIYLWAIAHQDGYLVYYVGETGRSFIVRFTEHTREYLYGLYRIYDPEEFVLGQKVLVWEGMWKPGTKGRMGEFLNRYPDLSASVYQLLGLFQIFIAPLDVETRVRQRIESSIARHLNAQSGVIGSFQDDDIRYARKGVDEIQLVIAQSFPVNILGMANRLTA